MNTGGGSCGLAGPRGTDAHRTRLRHEDNGLALYYGPALVFTTPNPADTRSMLTLYACGKQVGRGDGARAGALGGAAAGARSGGRADSGEVDLQLSEPQMKSINEMHAILASDPVGVAVAFDFAMRLFLIHVLGVRAEVIGLPRRGGKRWARNAFADGFAFSSTRPRAPHSIYQKGN